MMVKVIWWVTGILIAVGLGAIYYFRPDGGEPAPTPTEQPELPAPAEAPAPAIRHPLPSSPPPDAAAQTPLPPLNESDKPIEEALAQTTPPASISQFLVTDNIVRRFVTTIDNLPRAKVAVQLRPFKPTPGQTVVIGDADEDETVVLSEQNYARYTPFIEMMKAADAKALSALYLRFYPLFQQSYEDLGYPKSYFNDRVVEVIDHLLETPDVQGPIKLKRPKVFYEFADPALERRSAGQKLLIRMGPQNAAAVKEKLRELKREIAAGAAPEGE